MAKLLFTNPHFIAGENISVRRGVKWDVGEKKSIQIADAQNPDAVLFTSDIETMVIPFSELRDVDVKKEHDPNCRTVRGLLSVMQEVYPTFTDREIVTLVRFTKP